MKKTEKIALALIVIILFMAALKINSITHTQAKLAVAVHAQQHQIAKLQDKLNRQTKINKLFAENIGE